MNSKEQIINELKDLVLWYEARADECEANHEWLEADGCTGGARVAKAQSNTCREFVRDLNAVISRAEEVTK